MKKKIRWKSQQRYVAERGIKCPACGSDAVEGGAIDIDGEGAAQECGCPDCGAAWVDCYKLVGYLKVVDPG
jgi:transcription elongation factor Elf1